jgi:hypothetical protein
MDEDILIPGFFFFTVIVLSFGIPMMRARIRQMDRGLSNPPGDPQINERLHHIEQAIDAIAVEVERIAEGQRFVTRVMAERPEPMGLPRGNDRIA